MKKNNRRGSLKNVKIVFGDMPCKIKYIILNKSNTLIIITENIQLKIL